ncbi:MAG: TIGR00282 family metallophosphoesterase [bacterium]
MRAKARSATVRVLMLGDVVGKAGRTMLAKRLPVLRKKHHIDCVIANVENLAHGKGITARTLGELLRTGVDVCTSGNHVFNKEGEVLLRDPKYPVIRPANYPDGTAGRGWITVPVRNTTLLIINLIGTVFFRDGATYKNPFQTADTILDLPEAESADGIIIDWHTEATSEKLALGWYLDGRATAVFGTHTHVATDDLRILPKGTAYRSDLGMVGLRDEILGAERGVITENFVHPESSRAHTWTEEGPTQLHGVLLDIDTKMKCAIRVEKIDQEAEG